MRAVNLMKKQAAETRRMPPIGVLLAALAPIAALLIVVFAYSYEQGDVKKGKEKLAGIQAQVAAVPAPRVANLSALAGLVTAADARRSSLDSALGNRFALDQALVAIARILPSDVWLTSLNLASPTPADKPPPAPAPTTTTGTTTTTTTTARTATTPAPAAPTVNLNALTINGYTYSQRSVARLLTQLALLPMLSDVALTSSTASSSSTPNAGSPSPGPTAAAKTKQTTLVEFAISAAVNPPPVEEGT